MFILNKRFSNEHWKSCDRLKNICSANLWLGRLHASGSWHLHILNFIYILAAALFHHTILCILSRTFSALQHYFIFYWTHSIFSCICRFHYQGAHYQKNKQPNITTHGIINSKKLSLIVSAVVKSPVGPWLASKNFTIFSRSLFLKSLKLQASSGPLKERRTYTILANNGALSFFPAQLVDRVICVHIAWTATDSWLRSRFLGALSVRESNAPSFSFFKPLRACLKKKLILVQTGYGEWQIPFKILMVSLEMSKDARYMTV